MTMDDINYNLVARPESEKFFSPGDTVVLKQPVSNKPIMIVKTIDRVAEVHDKPKLLGVTCMWFNTKHELQTARFSTKDLDKYEKPKN